MATNYQEDARKVVRVGEDMGRAVVARGNHAVDQVRDAAAERPNAVVAAAALMGFALGALWKIGRRRPINTYEALLNRADAIHHQAPAWGGATEYLPKSWR